MILFISSFFVLFFILTSCLFSYLSSKVLKLIKKPSLMSIYPKLVLSLFVAYALYRVHVSEHHTYVEFMRKILKPAIITGLMAIAYHVLGIHKYFGFFKRQETSFHFMFLLKTLWVVLLWGLGQVSLVFFLLFFFPFFTFFLNFLLVDS